jgi:hypothetical protein
MVSIYIYLFIVSLIGRIVNVETKNEFLKSHFDIFSKRNSSSKLFFLLLNCHKVDLLVHPSLASSVSSAIMMSGSPPLHSHIPTSNGASSSNGGGP